MISFPKIYQSAIVWEYEFRKNGEMKYIKSSRSDIKQAEVLDINNKRILYG